jgi:hypothetical protein
MIAVALLWLLNFKMFKLINDRSIGDLSIADARSSIITRPQIIMPMECQEFVFLIGE